MGMKYKTLKQLVDKKINVHSFENISELDELLKYADENEKFSMRFDRDKDYYQLPFYKFNNEVFENDEVKIEYLTNIMDEAKRLNCTILCANGYLYDDVQICNFVIKIDRKANFILEYSTKKVPLREMYEYKTTTIKGNIKDSLHEMEWIGKNENKLDDRSIEKMINWAFKLNVTDKNIEATLYPTKVGMLKETIVCWQID